MEFRILLIIFNTIISSFIFLKTDNFITLFFSILVLIFQIFLLLKNQINEKEKTIGFIESLISNDNDSIKLNSKSEFHRKISQALNNLNNSIYKKSLEIEQKNDLIENILLHLKSGLIIYNNNGEVELINKAARTLLSIAYINNINQLEEVLKDSYNEVTDFNKNISKAIEINNIGYFLFESSIFYFNNGKKKILSIQDIKTTLNINEQNSWSKVIRTLNHEIMNSITPISSLASSSLDLIDKSNYDLYTAIETIERRSKNLLEFVDRYKSLSQIPFPKKELCNINEIIFKVKEVMKQYTEDIIYVPKIDEFVFVDELQIEQSLINLIKNSIEAGANKITITSETNESGYTIITVYDNGSGFTLEALENAFLPFYTTKDYGSGLGLSIIRQIMYLHGGDVRINNLQKGTGITLLLP